MGNSQKQSDHQKLLTPHSMRVSVLLGVLILALLVLLSTGSITASVDELEAKLAQSERELESLQAILTEHERAMKDYPTSLLTMDETDRPGGHEASTVFKLDNVIVREEHGVLCTSIDLRAGSEIVLAGDTTLDLYRFGLNPDERQFSEGKVGRKQPIQGSGKLCLAFPRYPAHDKLLTKLFIQVID